MTPKLKSKIEDNPESFFIPYFPQSNRIQKIDELFEKCIREKKSKEEKKEFYSFLKNTVELECWDLVTWGEKSLENLA